MVQTYKNTAETTTTDEYVQVWKFTFGGYPAPSSSTHLTIRIEEGETVTGVRTGVNDVLYKIVASNEKDGTDYPDLAETILAETALASGASDYQTTTDTWLEYAVYAKSAVAETAGVVKVTVAGG